MARLALIRFGLFASAFGTEEREEDHVADGRLPREQHHQPVDADTNLLLLYPLEAKASPTHMKREFDIVIERDAEGYYVASVPALRGCHTQARSLDQLIERVREAIELCLEAEADAGERLDFVGVQRIVIPA